LFGFVTKHACDRQTDRQNYDSQGGASIAELCSNKTKELLRDYSPKTRQEAKQSNSN